MVERGPEHERSAATHDGWGTGTLRSGHVYYYPVAQPTAVQFSAPVTDAVRPSTTHASAAGSLLQPTTVVAQHAWNESTGADLHTDCAFEAGDELTVSECPGQWWMTGRVRGGSARERAVRFLLQSGANPRLPDSSGVTPLIATVLLGQRCSLEAAAALSDELHGCSLLELHRRAEECGVPSERLLAAGESRDPKRRTTSLLQRALAAQRADAEVLSLLRLLLQRGAAAGVDAARSRDGSTAFHLACRAGLAGCVEALVRAGCDESLCNAAGETGRQLAADAAPSTAVLRRLRTLVLPVAQRRKMKEREQQHQREQQQNADEDAETAAVQPPRPPKHRDWGPHYPHSVQHEIVLACRRGDCSAMRRLFQDGDGCEINALLSTGSSSSSSSSSSSGSKKQGDHPKTTALLAAILDWEPTGLFPASLLRVTDAPPSCAATAEPPSTHKQMHFLRRRSGAGGGGGEEFSSQMRPTLKLKSRNEGGGGEGCPEGMCRFCYADGRRNVPVLPGSECCVELRRHQQ
jgi:hypothetical protein